MDAGDRGLTGPHDGEHHPQLQRLAEVMHALRRGCPWDAAQTHASLVTYLVEEAAEVVEAIETGSAFGHSSVWMRLATKKARWSVRFKTGPVVPVSHARW